MLVEEDMNATLSKPQRGDMLKFKQCFAPMELLY
ncbi:MAG: hypothetical protein RLZZ306_2890 [Bacteroidota bacterium]